MKLWLIYGALVAVPARADVTTVPSREDPRVHTVRYTDDQPVRLQTTPGNTMTVILAPGERIGSFNVSNNAAHQVTLSDSRDSFILHTSMVLFQGAPPSSGTITFSSEGRAYKLLLSSAPADETPYVLRFTYDRSDGGRGARGPANAQYKLKGNKELRPSSIRDDGSKTYIRWDATQPIPAVFGLDRLEREEMVDGYMRDGVFTIDRVHDRLIFRIDDAEAQARRSKRKSGE